MNKLVLAALFAAAAGAAMPGFAHNGGVAGRGFHGGAFHGHRFAHPAPFRGAAAFPVHRGFFPRHHHHRHSAVFIGAGIGFPAYYYPRYYNPVHYGPVYYPAYYAPPVYHGVPVAPSPVMRLYCQDPEGYFPEVRDCRRDWVQVPQEGPQESRQPPPAESQRPPEPQKAP
jgi:hypothetical protein